MALLTPEMVRVGRDSTPRISDRFNDVIDFCVWVLEHDRLRVPPFEHHPQATGALQRQGLTPEIWRIWFERVVRWQHSSFINWVGWYQSRDHSVLNPVSNCRDMIVRLMQYPDWQDFNLDTVDWGRMRVDWGEVYDADEAAAQAAAQEAQISHYDHDSIPTDFFPVPEARELRRSLEALWHQYDRVECDRRMEQQGYPQRYHAPQPRLAYRTQLRVPHLNIHQIAYDSPVIMSVPSSSIVVSAAVDLDSEAFKAFVLEAFGKRA